MDWKKAKYPYSYNIYQKEFMDNIALPNFERFKNAFGIDKINIFNYGWKVEKVFNRGKSSI